MSGICTQGRAPRDNGNTSKMGCHVSSWHLPGAVPDPQQKCGFVIEHTHRVCQSAIPCQVRRIILDCPTRQSSEQLLGRSINSLKISSWLNWQSSGFDRYHHEATDETMSLSCAATMKVEAIKSGESPLLTSTVKRCTTKANVPCLGKRFLTGCKKCLISTRRKAKR